MKILSLNKKQPDPAKALILICAELIRLSGQKRITPNDKLSLGYYGVMGLCHTARLSKESRRIKSGK
jgi:hypothetical protein